MVRFHSGYVYKRKFVMANLIYVSVKGKKQGLISAGCSTFDSIGNKYQSEHENEIMVLGYEHGISREENVNHDHVTFIKLIDKSSPLFGIAISENESLELYFSFYRNSVSGANQLFYSVRLTEAFISRIDVTYPHVLIDHPEKQPEEAIAVKYKSITWKHHIAGTSGYSIWDDRVY